MDDEQMVREDSRFIGVGVGGGHSQKARQTSWWQGQVDGVDFIVAKPISMGCESRTQAGTNSDRGKLTKGLGAGADPNVGPPGRGSKTPTAIMRPLSGADMIFVDGRALAAAPAPRGAGHPRAWGAELGALTICTSSPSRSSSREKNNA